MAPIYSILVLSIASLMLCIPIFVFVLSIIIFYVPFMDRGLGYNPANDRWFDIRLNSLWLAFLAVLTAQLVCFLIPVTMWLTHNKIPAHLRSHTSPAAAKNVYITLAGMAFALSPIAAIYLWMDHHEAGRHGRLANETSLCYITNESRPGHGFANGTGLCPWSLGHGGSLRTPRFSASEVPPEAWSCKIGRDFAISARNPDAMRDLHRLCQYSRSLPILFVFLTLLLAALMIWSLLLTFKKEVRRESLAAEAAEGAARSAMTQSARPASTHTATTSTR